MMIVNRTELAMSRSNLSGRGLLDPRSKGPRFPRGLGQGLAPCSVVTRILHLMMAIGRLLGEFVYHEAKIVQPSARHDLQVRGGAFTWLVPKTKKRRPFNFLRHGRRLLGFSALGQAWQKTKLCEHVGSHRGHLLYVPRPPTPSALQWRSTSAATKKMAASHGIF